jgi:endo-1,4-beta-xylanase
MNRRDFIKVMGLSTTTQWIPYSAAEQEATESLKQLADQKGLMFGSSLALKYFAKSPRYRDLFVTQCNIATPELHMKWDSLSPKKGEYDFANADQFVSFCDSNRIRVHGHTLVWHDSLPSWVAEQASSATAQTILLDHIHTVAGHFAGRLYSWDVLNEALDPGSTRQDGLRSSLWLQNIGIDYIEHAFRAAAAADPKALLMWNENYLEVSNGFGEAKRKAMLQQLDRLLARGVPIHGIGLEAHLRTDQAGVLGDERYERFLGELAKRRLKIFVTELDVQDSTLPGDVSVRDAAIAALYKKFLTSTLREPGVKGVITWGLSDSYTWISGYRPRQDGLAVRPLAFDSDFHPKPAYYAIVDAINAAPRRS